MDQETIIAATKKLRAEKPKENFMMVEFAYDHKIVLPHKDGVALLSALANAEKLDDRYSGPKRIVSLEREAFKFQNMSHQEYELYKLAALLNISADELKREMEAANQPTP